MFPYVEQYLSLASEISSLSSVIFSILISIPIKFVSMLPDPRSLWMVLTCLEGSLEAVEWRMDGIPDLIKVQREERMQHVKQYSEINQISWAEMVAQRMDCLEGKGIELVPIVRTVDEGLDLVSVQPWTVREVLD